MLHTFPGTKEVRATAAVLFGAVDAKGMVILRQTVPKTFAGAVQRRELNGKVGLV